MTEWMLHQNRAMRLFVKITLAFLPLICLLLFFGKHQTAASVAPMRSTAPVPKSQDFSILKATSIDSRFVEVSVGQIATDFQGEPLQRFAEAIKENPQASTFHLTWWMGTPGGEIEGKLFYAVKAKELTVVTQEGNIDAGWNRDETDNYSHVTLDKIFRLDRKYPAEQTYDFNNFGGLTQFGCPCRTVRRR